MAQKDHTKETIPYPFVDAGVDTTVGYWSS